MNDFLRIPYAFIKPLYQRTSFHRSVIEELDDQQLKDAYAQCRAITRKHAKTFYMATRFLPNHKQRGIFAIYSLCRYVDDLVDEAEDLVEQQQLNHQDIRLKLNRWKQKLKDTYEGRSFDNPILFAFSDVLRRYHIPIEMPFELMEGVCMDLYKNRYESFDEVYDYSFKVASIVGLMTSQVFGYESKEALGYAIDLGIAMQLTNILRDVGEDLQKDRIYLPQEDLRKFGVSESDLFNHARTEAVKELLAFQIDRARRYYVRSDKGIGMLSADSRLPVYLARHNYSRILDKIEQNNYNVFDIRAYLNTTEKLSIIPQVFYRTKIATT
ncbi:phytoene/squalene synthase family protein [Fodinibius salsisoli]|uniref:Squalene/phytoene synthase family protein n=1 Tax=Fodinibius salsisoli TaxID=2820877 RepID=A0ABT3PSX1_9BACT|nr:squalene/phytoene synthase family protein [Fodinibius salsisoli]MCW9708941.1 squalene/phytoene synthase family protein [Fodinibius salsisoli]